MNNNDFGKNLRILRKAKGFTQEVLAEKAEIDEKHLSRIENGRYFPTYSTLSRLLISTIRWSTTTTGPMGIRKAVITTLTLRRLRLATGRYRCLAL